VGSNQRMGLSDFLKHKEGESHVEAEV
jgi:hypothetical protein